MTVGMPPLVGVTIVGIDPDVYADGSGGCVPLSAPVGIGRAGVMMTSDPVTLPYIDRERQAGEAARERLVELDGGLEPLLGRFLRARA